MNKSCLLLHRHPPVIYWPSTEPSIKRCTCINKQRNSGSRWAWDNYITRCHRQLGSVPVGVGVSWGTRCQRENQLNMYQYVSGQYVAVCPCLQLTSHTQPTSTLSRIKCERYIFIKKCVRSFIEVRHYCWLCFRIYLYMYVAIQHPNRLTNVLSLWVPNSWVLNLKLSFLK